MKDIKKKQKRLNWLIKNEIMRKKMMIAKLSGDEKTENEILNILMKNDENRENKINSEQIGDEKGKLRKEEAICEQIIKKKHIEKKCSELDSEIQFINSLKKKKR